MSDVGQIYGLISKISQEAGALKKERSGGVKYEFRGIDSVVNHLHPIMAKHGVIAVPDMVEHELRDITVGGKAVKVAKLTYGVNFYAPDGSSLRATVPGESQDYSDKASAQAASVAFRIALLQTFMLPTDSPDPELSQIGNEDATTPAGQKIAQAAPKRPTVTAAGAGNERPVTPQNITALATKAKVMAGERGLAVAALNKIGEEVVGGPFSTKKVDHLTKLLEHLEKNYPKANAETGEVADDE